MIGWLVIEIAGVLGVLHPKAVTRKTRVIFIASLILLTLVLLSVRYVITVDQLKMLSNTHLSLLIVTGALTSLAVSAFICKKE